MVGVESTARGTTTPMERMVAMPQADARLLIMEAIDHLEEWALPSAESFRNAVLGNGLIGINPMLQISTIEQAKLLQNLISDVIRDGRMIDFGTVPNEVFKAESIRSRVLFENGDLPHPYEDWLAVARWEGGLNGYYFSQRPGHPNHVLCMELYGVRLKSGHDLILIYDIIHVEAKSIGDTLVTPATTVIEEANLDKKGLEARGANCLDPLVTFLGMLSDASIPIIDHPAPDKLNRQRVKQGKYSIPAHSAVMTKDYVSAFRGSGSSKGESKGGHHASPVAHMRRAHMRHIHNPDRIIPVRSSKVNWRTQEELHRLFYRIPKR